MDFLSKTEAKLKKWLIDKKHIPWIKLNTITLINMYVYHIDFFIVSFFFYLCCRFYIHEKKYITYDCNVYKSQFPSIYIYISFFISCQDLRVRQHLPDNLRGDREVPGSLQASPL